jgi:hypothetical protein
LVVSQEDEPLPEHELVRRRDAAQDALDYWRPRPWRMGENDCVRMFARHARLLGYVVRIPPARSYRTVKGAKFSLAALGHASLPAAIDALGLPRISPAEALVGDVIQLPGDDDDLPALTIALGNGRVVGWHESVKTGAEVLQPLAFVTAWRLEPVNKALCQ